MGLVRDARRAVQLIREMLDNRRARGELNGRLARLPELPTNHFSIAVYFADGPVNLYQLRQWYAPLAELSKTWPVVILSRVASTATRLVEEAPLSVAYVRTVKALEQTLDEQNIRVVLYVNQNAKNFQMFRYGRRWHVFINHGESDKMYMTTNQFKAYDYALIAGDAARERLGRALWNYDFDRRAIPIGRPQADHYTGETPYPDDDRTVVLYSPTWEGDRAAASYGSVLSHGVALARAVLASPVHRLIYRPHPRSGVVDHAFGQANREIIAMIEAANRADPAAVHIYDSGAEIGWQIGAADVAIVDVSAMVYDRLAAGKPLLVTRPTNPLAEIDAGGYLGDCEWLDAADADAVLPIIDRVRTDEVAQARLGDWVEHYFGDVSPGAPTRRFHEAISGLMAEWEHWAERDAASRDDAAPSAQDASRG